MSRTNAGTWKLGVFWERTTLKSPKIEQNRRELLKIASYRARNLWNN